MAWLAVGLVALQFLLGALNVMAALPTALREAHAANAALVFVVLVIAAALASIELPAGARRHRLTSVESIERGEFPAPVYTRADQ